MRIPPHLISLYIKTARRYKKLISKIHRETVSSYQRKTFAQQLKKLGKKLQDLQLQLKIAAATGAVVMLLNASPVQAQSGLGPFVKQNRAINPLREPLYTGYLPATTIVDFDQDGDFDVVVGDYSGEFPNGASLRYFENQTSNGSPVYDELVDTDNPFNGIYASTYYAAPAFADIDKDGDLDLFLGQRQSYVQDQYPYNSSRGIEYYRNDNGIFSKQTGAWNASSKQGNPFDGILLGREVSPVFVDFDKDGDQDMLIGSYVLGGTYPNYTYKYVHLYKNNGDGNFTPSDLTLNSHPSNGNRAIYPALADMDGDGDYDMVIGSYDDGNLKYYKQTTPGNFEEQTGPWNAGAKTGNPFNNYEVGLNASPAFIDFDQDGDLDLFVADSDGYYEEKYSDNIINYYKKSGDGGFAEIDGFENPFDGITVKDYASPVLLDIDGDDELDAVIGNKYNESYFDPDLDEYVYTYSSLAYYKKNEEEYEQVTDDTNPFEGLEIQGHFAAQFADVDGDNDLDIVSGSDSGEVVFFKNDDGVYSREIELNPFANINPSSYTAIRLVDIDNDKDLDLFVATYNGIIHFFKNTGTAQQPQYEEQFEGDNPVTSNLTWNISFLNFTDIDHDGDLDLFFNGTSLYDVETEAYLYYENTGSPENPVFDYAYEDVFPGINPEAHVDLVDYDGDGDLDVFAGNEDGSVSYLENQNPIVQTTVTGTVALYEPGDDPIIVEPNLTLIDPDDDHIIQATVTIEDFQPGEILAFTSVAEGVSGYFDADTGVLHFRGMAHVGDYQDLLRTVTFETEESANGRKRSPKSILEKTISFAVFDVDFTHPELASKKLNIFVNTPPEIQPEPVKTFTGLTKTINLLDITSDAEDNLDPESFTIVKQPSSGAVATVAFVSSDEVNLNLNYDGIEFRGNDQLTIRACDEAGACTDRVITVNVESGIMVYNAVAPNSQGHDNTFMRIAGLGKETNRVSVYNRWGDKVYDVKNYENTVRGNSFKGLNNNGNALPSGTYFYKIETGKKVITGYLTLKQ